MKRRALYSSSPRTRPSRPPSESPREAEPSPSGALAPAPSAPAPGARLGLRSRVATALDRRRPLLALLIGALVAWLAIQWQSPPQQRRLTQKDIDEAVFRTLETKPLPSPAEKAYDVIRPSVVRVRDLVEDEENGEEVERGVGTGVVIVDKGIILTNLHVVAGAKKVGVVFADGLESEAVVVSMQPENDLAVLQARQIPDDLTPATMRSTADLLPGDEVVAVGFPFGIGPSVTAGVVSGLRREYLSPEGKRVLTNLIQFDAAANPGSSGGPLVTKEGEVVGIVTAILNPTEQRVFVGIGFAVPIENAAGGLGLSPF